MSVPSGATPSEVIEYSPALLPPVRRVRPRVWDRDDAGILFGSALSGLALAWLAYYRLTPAAGGIGFALCWLAAALGIYWMVERDTHGPVIAVDRTANVGIGAIAALLLLPLVLIVGYVVVQGAPALGAAFFTKTLEFVGPLSKATDGGGAHAIVGTFQQVGLAMLLSVPLGLLTAVFLNEVGGPLARPVRTIVDAMSGVPSIVAGLFIYAVWIVQFGHGFSGFAAGLALSVLMLPTVTRAAEVVLRLVPSGLREAALALGAPEWRVTWSVVLPTARSGLVTAVILGVARAVGETAPLIMTSFGASVMNANPLDGPQDSLPLFVYRLVRSPQASQVQRAWTGALVLVMIVLGLFVLARTIGSGRRRRSPKVLRASEATP